jgi:hypothetical protein
MLNAIAICWLPIDTRWTNARSLAASLPQGVTTHDSASRSSIPYSGIPCFSSNAIGGVDLIASGTSDTLSSKLDAAWNWKCLR